VKVTINQSNYIPWKGYFDLIHDADLFIFYDDVQYTKNDWRNRNLVKGPNGPQWLTIPVGTSLDRLVCEVSLSDQRWQTRHWNTLRHLYGRAPFFSQYRPLFEDVYLGRRWGTLSELNQFLIHVIARELLGVKTTFRSSSEFRLSGARQDRVLNLLEAVGADVYVSGPAGQAYLDPPRFTEAGIELVWKDYSGYPEYPQFHGDFRHRVTVLDLLFHVGPNAPHYIWGWRDTIVPA
jgi:WbqC-like protein family